jgi:hypothetical protein
MTLPRAADIAFKQAVISGQLETRFWTQNNAVIRFFMLASIRSSTPSFITTVQVIPVLISTPTGTCVRRMRTGMRCASLTHVNVGLTDERSWGPSLLSWSVMPLAIPMTVPCNVGDPSMR